MTAPRTAFIFEDWRALAESDPQAFEEKRKSVLRAEISRAPDSYRGRLSSLQWRVDRERERSSTPLSACVKITEMMWGRVYGRHGLVETLKGTTKAEPLPEVPDNVVSIERRKD